MRTDDELDPDLVQLFDTEVRDEPPTRFKPIGSFTNRHEADDFAAAMIREMPWTSWESCRNGTSFAIRRVR